MKKLAIIGVVVVGMTVPPAATAGNLRHHLPSCCESPIFQHGKNVTLRGPQVFENTATVWVRDAVTGRITPIPCGKWRTEDGR